MRTKQSRQFIDKIIINYKKDTKNYRNVYYCEIDDKANYGVKYIVVDNTTGDCWVEEFYTLFGTLSSIWGRDNVIKDVLDVIDIAFDMEEILYNEDCVLFDEVLYRLAMDNHRDLIEVTNEDRLKELTKILKKY